MLKDKLTDMDYQMIDFWRKSNIGYKYEHKFIKSQDLLKVWEEGKESGILSKLFNGELILKKEVRYRQSDESLMTELNKLIYPSRRLKEEGVRVCDTFKKSFENLCHSFKGITDAETRILMLGLLGTRNLINNKWKGENFTIPFPNGKQYRVSKGSKITRVLGKIAEAFNLEGWEDFRICHSQVLNQKVLSGNLVISIHPMDYITMSDNNSGWDSCMSWRSGGEYCLGTTEMMNSPCVLVAYLESSTSMAIGDEHTWSNKKWRELYVVDENLIANVKSYPYDNENLTKEVMNWLKDLMIQNCGLSYSEIYKYDYNNYYTKGIENNNFSSELLDLNFYVEFETNAMYNDFGCLPYHFISFNKQLNRDSKNIRETKVWNSEIQDYIPLLVLDTNYSGKSQCMICGDTNYDNFYNESMLACDYCNDVNVCDICGEIYSGDPMIVDGYSVCDYCAETRFVTCDYCDETHYDEDITKIYVIPCIPKEEQKRLFDQKRESTTYRTWFFEDDKYNPDIDYGFIDYSLGFNVCSDCLDDWALENLKYGTRLHETARPWQAQYVVYFNDLNLTNLAKKRFGLDKYESNEDYKNSFSYDKLTIIETIN